MIADPVVNRLDKCRVLEIRAVNLRVERRFVRGGEFRLDQSVLGGPKSVGDFQFDFGVQRSEAVQERLVGRIQICRRDIFHVQHRRHLTQRLASRAILDHRKRKCQTGGTEKKVCSRILRARLRQQLESKTVVRLRHGFWFHLAANTQRQQRQ